MRRQSRRTQALHRPRPVLSVLELPSGRDQWLAAWRDLPDDRRDVHCHPDFLALIRRYKVLRCIGQGGNGLVHEVEHVRTGRKLALKSLLDEAGYGRLEQDVLPASAKIPDLVCDSFANLIICPTTNLESQRKIFRKAVDCGNQLSQAFYLSEAADVADQQRGLCRLFGW